MSCRCSRAKAGFVVAAAFAVVLAVYVRLVRPWHRRWGATDGEVVRPLPGDELIPEPKHDVTHALLINASPGEVWPWIAQMGQGRGGLYSYDGLENLAGCDIHSVDCMLPELQDLQPGDVVSLRRGDNPSFLVDSLEPARFLLLRSRDPKTNRPLSADDPKTGGWAATWVFFLEEAEGGSTRLIVRYRAKGAHYGLEAVHFVMERKMLLGIRARAEAGALEAEAAAP